MRPGEGGGILLFHHLQAGLGGVGGGGGGDFGGGGGGGEGWVGGGGRGLVVEGPFWEALPSVSIPGGEREGERGEGLFFEGTLFRSLRGGDTRRTRRSISVLVSGRKKRELSSVPIKKAVLAALERGTSRKKTTPPWWGGEGKKLVRGVRGKGSVRLPAARKGRREV